MSPKINPNELEWVTVPDSVSAFQAKLKINDWAFTLTVCDTYAWIEAIDRKAYLGAVGLDNAMAIAVQMAETLASITTVCYIDHSEQEENE